MAVVPGTSDDAAATGMAGRIATAIKAAFAGTTYVAGSIGVKGIDAMAKGIADSLNLDKGIASDSLLEVDTRSVADLPADAVLTKKAITCALKQASTISLSATGAAYYMVVTFAPWSDDSGGGVHQMAFGSSATATLPNIYWREGSIAGNTWSAWVRIDSKAEADSKQIGTAFGPLVTASGWTDLPGASVTFTPQNTTKKARATVKFSGYADTVAGVLQVRLLINGSAHADVFPAFYNTLSQHQGWAFDWIVAAGGISSIGTGVTVKVQVQVPGGVRFNMDTNDSTAFVVEEIG